MNDRKAEIRIWSRRIILIAFGVLLAVLGVAIRSYL